MKKYCVYINGIKTYCDSKESAQKFANMHKPMFKPEIKYEEEKYDN